MVLVDGHALVDAVGIGPALVVAAVLFLAAYLLARLPFRKKDSSKGRE